MMKRQIYTILLRAVCLVFCCFVSVQAAEPIQADSEAEPVPYEEVLPVACVEADVSAIRNLDDLREGSGYIVRGRLRDDAVQHLFTDARGLIIYGYNVSTLEITAVYQGELQAGDIIELGEEYYTVTQDGETEIYGSNSPNYYPSKPDREYLFFLKRRDLNDPDFPGIYYPYRCEFGRYPILPEPAASVDVENIPNEEWSLGPYDWNVKKYHSLYREVIEQYMK